ncbi:MAG: trypsin-like peptidase domain-containing protein [bacterium]|nr:trypsin-like peptidase domain-containing protein [bacterium]
MSRNRFIVFLLTGMLALAACQAQVIPPTAQPAASTPLGDLPISLSAQLVSQLPTAVPEEVIAAADAEYLLLTNIYERITPSVVSIEVIIGTLNEVERGSGFVYDRNGRIITNAHVVNQAESINVTFNDGYVAEAELVGVDVFSDLAVLQVNVEADRLYPLALGDSDLVRVGERAIAIGNPFGLSSSLTVGIVSGLGRQLPSATLVDANAIPGFQNPRIIQVDTDINPGNSGGPLLNSRGEVIGVNTAIRTESGTFEGVGFAVPANTVRRVVPELIENGEVRYSWLGISTDAAEDGFGVASLAEALDLPVTAGVLVRSVSPDSPAQTAGLQGGTSERLVRGRRVCVGGDIIVAIDGQYINNMDELLAYLIVRTRPGDTVSLMIVRNGETFEVPLTLRERISNSVNPPCGDTGG